jgi:transcriptional regulator with XRE-family HTH domain
MQSINIPERIRQIRKSLKLSQRELGERIGRSRDAIKDYELNRSRIAAEDWEKIKALEEKKGEASRQ